MDKISSYENDYDRRQLSRELYAAGDSLLDRIVELREERGLSQRDLARIMGVSQPYISQIENGQVRLTDKITDLLYALGARIEYPIQKEEDARRDDATGDLPVAITNWNHESVMATAELRSGHIRIPASSQPKDLSFMSKGQSEENEAEGRIPLVHIPALDKVDA
jgi:transcriptional regulator with XRE-family HTH domain